MKVVLPFELVTDSPIRFFLLSSPKETGDIDQLLFLAYKDCMETINWLDSISILSLIQTYGYSVWVLIRDIVAWGISIGSFVLFAYLTYLYFWTTMRITEDSTIKEEGSDSNYYMSHLVLETGFGDDLDTFYDRYSDDLNRDQIFRKVKLYRTISLTIKIFFFAFTSALIGAEWGVFGLVLVGFIMSLTDSKAYYYCYKYEDYVRDYVEEEGAQ